ncbi:MAG: signal recognition particle-docking protein FtsY [Anaerolineae bacterium]|nr:signal recognition particle-docking protein FtsY [Anaerolineae bacterium]
MAGIFDSLRKTRNAVFGQIAALLGAGEVTEQTWDDLEELLIRGDVGVETSMALVQRLRQRVTDEGIFKATALQRVLEQEVLALLPTPQPLGLDWPLAVILIVGVNGSGKTTSIAKLAYRLSHEGRKVMLAAADTFRAAAIDQLKIWGDRAGTPVVAGEEGSDPGAVVYEAIQQARSQGMDTLIIDTAGRLHTQHNLMAELEKLRRILSTRVAWAPHETLLVLDAATGQNGLAQAKQFTKSVKVTGIILAKLDGSAKGGMALSIGNDLGLPIRFVGTGEKMGDFAPFDPQAFAEGLLRPA